MATVSGIVVLAGCGSSAKHASVPSHPANQTPQQSSPDSTQVAATAPKHRARVRVRVRPGAARASRRVNNARSTYATSRDDQHAAAKAFNPCGLVTLAEARVAAGGSVTSQAEAPLGPSCVYRRSAPNTEITIAVEALTLSQAVHQVGKPQPVSVGGQKGYCVRSGTQALFVPLTAGRLLQVTAPCAIAQRFAVRALTRLAA